MSCLCFSGYCIDMFVESSIIFNLAALGIFVSFYCCTVFKLFMFTNVAYGLQELNKTYLQTN